MSSIYFLMLLASLGEKIATPRSSVYLTIKSSTAPEIKRSSPRTKPGTLPLVFCKCSSSIIALRVSRVASQRAILFNLKRVSSSCLSKTMVSPINDAFEASAATASYLAIIVSILVVLYACCNTASICLNCSAAGAYVSDMILLICPVTLALCSTYISTDNSSSKAICSEARIPLLLLSTVCLNIRF